MPWQVLVSQIMWKSQGPKFEILSFYTCIHVDRNDMIVEDFELHRERNSAVKIKLFINVFIVVMFRECFE